MASPSESFFTRLGTPSSPSSPSHLSNSYSSSTSPPSRRNSTSLSKTNSVPLTSPLGSPGTPTTRSKTIALASTITSSPVPPAPDTPQRESENAAENKALPQKATSVEELQAYLDQAKAQTAILQQQHKEELDREQRRKEALRREYDELFETEKSLDSQLQVTKQEVNEAKSKQQELKKQTQELLKAYKKVSDELLIHETELNALKNERDEAIEKINLANDSLLNADKRKKEVLEGTKRSIETFEQLSNELKLKSEEYVRKERDIKEEVVRIESNLKQLHDDFDHEQYLLQRERKKLDKRIESLAAVVNKTRQAYSEVFDIKNDESYLQEVSHLVNEAARIRATIDIRSKVEEHVMNEIDYSLSSPIFQNISKSISIPAEQFVWRRAVFEGEVLEELVDFVSKLPGTKPPLNQDKSTAEDAKQFYQDAQGSLNAVLENVDKSLLSEYFELTKLLKVNEKTERTLISTIQRLAATLGEDVSDILRQIEEKPYEDMEENGKRMTKVKPAIGEEEEESDSNRVFAPHNYIQLPNNESIWFDAEKAKTKRMEAKNQAILDWKETLLEMQSDSDSSDEEELGGSMLQDDSDDEDPLPARPREKKLQFREKQYHLVQAEK